MNEETALLRDTRQGLTIMMWNYDMHKAYAAELEARAQRQRKTEGAEDDTMRAQQARRNQQQRSKSR